ncbi:MAG: hypothetical protein K2O70_08975, partial [Desulfovibrionaceae bacterium]|nr:hypothetical protein [Desulfovibrionaceae bacterium]
RPVIGLCSNFQLTELGQGEQPIETLQLEYVPFENTLPTAGAVGRRRGISALYLRCVTPERGGLSAVTL